MYRCAKCGEETELDSTSVVELQRVFHLMRVAFSGTVGQEKVWVSEESRRDQHVPARWVLAASQHKNTAEQEKSPNRTILQPTLYHTQSTLYSHLPTNLPSQPAQQLDQQKGPAAGAHVRRSSWIRTIILLLYMQPVDLSWMCDSWLTSRSWSANHQESYQANKVKFELVRGKLARWDFQDEWS